jgi:hypothetical protein
MVAQSTWAVSLLFRVTTLSGPMIQGLNTQQMSFMLTSDAGSLQTAGAGSSARYATAQIFSKCSGSMSGECTHFSSASLECPLMARSKGAESADVAPEWTVTGASSMSIGKIQSFECSMLWLVSYELIASPANTHLMANGILRRFGSLVADGCLNACLVTRDDVAVHGRICDSLKRRA